MAAIFDLAESVDRQTPKIRRMLRYVRVFVSVWLLLDFFLIIVLAAIGGGNPAAAFLLFIPIIALLFAMRRISGSTARLVLLILVIVFANLQIISIGGLLFVGVVLVALFVLGFIILELMRDLRSFFDYFALRHRVIQRVRQADPVVYVPEGKDAVERILAHLASSSPDVRGLMAIPGAVAIPALLTGKSGLAYSFDAYVRRSPSQLWRTVSLGSPGYAVFVKAFERAPTLHDLNALRAADARLNIEWKRTTAVFGPNLTACTGLISSLRISKPRAKRRHRRMTKQDVYVESNTAQSLAAQASSRGKTLYSFTNEVLDVALRVLGQGGNENEIFPAWKTSRVSKDIGGAPFLPGSLIWKMVERLYRSDPEWLMEEWAEAGRRLGERLRILHPTVEDLQAGLSGLQSLIAERKIEVQRKPGGKDRAGIRLRVVTDLTPELAACGERFLEGVLSAYAFQVTETHTKAAPT